MPSSFNSSSTFSSTSFSTFTTSSSSSSGRHPQQQQQQQQTYTERATFNDRDGGRVERTGTSTGQPTWHETTRLDPQGRRVAGAQDDAAGTPSSRRRIEDVTDDEGAE